MDIRLNLEKVSEIKDICFAKSKPLTFQIRSKFVGVVAAICDLFNVSNSFLGVNFFVISPGEIKRIC